MRSWALDIKDFVYDGKTLKEDEDQSKRYPAVIDTGSSFIAVPPSEYLKL